MKDLITLLAGETSVGIAWYIEGALIPELYLRRGLTYNFRVYGGNNPHSANFYHPLIITDEPHGGYDTLTDIVRNNIRVLAGVELTRRGQPQPTAGITILTPFARISPKNIDCFENIYCVIHSCTVISYF